MGRPKRSFNSGSTLAVSKYGGPENEHLQPHKKTPDDLEIELGLPSDSEGRWNGCYLVFDSGSGGRLFAQWSEEEVDGAWAFFFPRVKVAPFKYKQNGGKTELIRGLQTQKKNLFSGWAQFIKLSYDNDGLLNIFEQREAEYWFLNSKNKINQVIVNEWMESKEIEVVAIIPNHCECFKGVQIMPPEQFVDTANKNSGTSWKPLR